MTRPAILFVLSQEQQQQYQAEIDGWRCDDLEFVFQSSADDALEQVEELDPRMTIVGMEVGPMEGLEFLALLMKRFAAYERPVVVLPAKEDPFPPVLHQRDKASGHSATDTIDLAHLGELIAIEAREAGKEPLGKISSAEQDFAGTAVTPKTFKSSPVSVVSPAASRLKWPLIGLAALLVCVVLGLAIFGGDDEAPAPADPTPVVSPSDTPREPAVATPDPAAAASVPASAPAVPGSAAAASPDEPASDASELETLATLPLGFKAGGAKFALAPGALDEVLRPYREQLDQNPRAKLEVGGHTSGEGASSVNRRLGRRRALQVKALLVKRGIAARRITVINYRETRPVASNDTPEGREQNRRVTLRLLRP
jgi:OOP family OmpA-OmpF porin